MSREIDRRTFTGGKLTPERADALLGFAERDSNNLPADHRVSITEFDTTTGNPATVLSEAAPAEKGNYVQRALDHVQKGISGTLGLEETQPAQYMADPNVQATSSGAVAVHLQQLYKGIPIFQSSQAVRFDPEGRLRDTIGIATTIPRELAIEPQLRVQAAVLAAAQQIATPDPDQLNETDQFGESLRPASVDLKGFTPQIIATFPNKPDQPTVLEAGPFGDEIKANLIWFDLDGDLRLAWEVILTLPSYASQYRTMVDAKDGTVLYCHELIHHIAARGNVYRVDGSSQREMVDFPLALNTYGIAIPSDLPNGFPDAWVDADLAEGNCVFAHLDDNGPTMRGTQQGNVVVFNPADAKGNAQRILNMFYLNCYVHNYFYLLGFRERDGNFQRNNAGRGGSPSDPVNARAYDGPIDKTASMFTPIDGSSPIMRMGLVTSTNNHTALDSSVIFHEYTHGVTNRLVGGQMNSQALDALQSQSMSEGWSDYIACTINKTTVVGAWVVGKPGGIRNFPYDSNYPHHFGDLGSGLYTAPHIHTIGEIWCAALLEMNRTIGANLGVQLVFDALRLTPANPSFLQARDAILRALEFKRDAGQLKAEQFTAARRGVWRAFAKFGMGPDAHCNDARNLNGISPDFNLPADINVPVSPTSAGSIHTEATPNVQILDDNTNGVTSSLAVTRSGKIARLSVSVDIQHSYRGDLQVSLISPAGTIVTLQAASDDSTNDLIRTYASETTPALAALIGQETHGDWKLKVADLAAQDSGVLRRWSLDVEVAPADAGLIDEDHDSAKLAAEAGDDLKLITGIKQGIERRFHSAGIMTYAQLAALSPAEIIERLGLSGIAARNVNVQNWVGQARDLATHMPADEAAESDLDKSEAELTPIVAGPTEQDSALAQTTEPQFIEQDSAGRQHYATFTVELLLGEESEVRRTRVKHIQEGEQETWAGWEDGRLVSFFVEHAALRRPTPETSQLEAVLAGAGDDSLLSDLSIDIADFDVDTIADDSNNGDRLRAEIEFQLAGLANKQVADQQATYFTHVLAYMIATGETIVLAAMQGQLQPSKLLYTKTVDFAPPQVGHYQLLVTVVLSDYNSVGAAVGPKLRVIP